MFPILKSSRKYYYHRRPIGDPLETHRRPTCLIGDQSETDMPHRRPIGDQHSSSETHWRPTCLIGDQHASSETNMPHQRPIINTYLAQGQSPIRHVDLRWVSDDACWSPGGLQSGMLVFDWSPIRHVGLNGVSDQACRS